MKKKQLDALWAKYDADGNGHIERDELMTIVKEVIAVIEAERQLLENFKAKLVIEKKDTSKVEAMTTPDPEKLLADLLVDCDHNTDGKIGHDEFQQSFGKWYKKTIEKFRFQLGIINSTEEDEWEEQEAEEAAKKLAEEKKAKEEATKEEHEEKKSALTRQTSEVPGPPPPAWEDIVPPPPDEHGPTSPKAAETKPEVKEK